MLSYEAAAVDGYYFIFRHGRFENHCGQFVFFRLAICRHQHGSVYNQIVGICSRQASAVFRVIDRVGQRQFYEMKGSAYGVSHFAQFVAHSFEFGKMLIVVIVAAGIYNNVAGGSYTGKGVDMAVGIVAGELAVLQPENFFCTKLLN